MMNYSFEVLMFNMFIMMTAIGIIMINVLLYLGYKVDNYLEYNERGKEIKRWLRHHGF